MPYTDQKNATMNIVRKHNIRAQKKYGQNFLTDEGVLDGIVEAAGVCGEDHVVEIGPGLGSLTKKLAEAASHVTAIEIDKKLIPILSETLAGCDNVEVIHADVLKVDLSAIAQKYAPEHSLKIVANLPYYITTPILMNLFRRNVPAQSITVMVQKEVADRMTAQPGSKDYGSLSVAVQYYSRPRIVEEVPPDSFIPHPKVTSSVVTMELYEELPVRAQNEDLFNTVVRAAFGQRRKTLVNALSSNAEVPFGKEQIASCLDQLGFPPAIRGEKLSIGDFVSLSDCLSASG